MKRFGSPILLTILSILSLLATGCANFRKLGADLKFIERTHIVSARVIHSSKDGQLYGIVVEWDRKDNQILSADFTKAGPLGIFGFYVEQQKNQYLMAFGDQNGNGLYDKSEPAWIHADASGNPAPVKFDPRTGKGRAEGRLSRATKLPEEMLDAARKFKGARTAEEAATGWNIPADLGTIADLDDAKFSSERGSRGYWEPASYQMETGIGIYFMEKYDPSRIPVLFVYGAAGSPQDWRTFINRLDRKKYQAWFAHYPTGRRLEEMGESLNRGIVFLQAYYGFQKVHVIAHSMGGLVSRASILQNLEEGNRHIGRYVTISTPWGGQEAAESGVKRAPSVIPSWRDMVPGSDFQNEVFDHHLRGRVDHLLLYGHRSKRSLILPAENDGTVSVRSETDPRAVKDAVEVIGYDEDHVTILSNEEVIRRAYRHLED